MKQTNEQLARIFAAYWGAKIKVAEYPYEYDIAILKDHSVCVGANGNDLDMWYKLSACKLILSRLSDITDEDAIEVGKIIGYFIPAQLREGKWLADNWNTQRSDQPVAIVMQVIDYLRSRHYDMGFLEIKSLIDCNIAIDKKLSL